MNFCLPIHMAFFLIFYRHILGYDRGSPPSMGLREWFLVYSDLNKVNWSVNTIIRTHPAAHQTNILGQNIISYRAEGPGWEILKLPPPPPSVCLSIHHVSFSHCNSKTHCCISSKLCRYMHHVMGVCCSFWYWLDVVWIFYEILKSAQSLTMWLNGRWFPQIATVGISIQYLHRSLVLIFYLISCFLRVLCYF